MSRSYTAFSAACWRTRVPYHSMGPPTKPFPSPPSLSRHSRCASTFVDVAPRITQPSLWKSIVPKAFRGEGQPSSPHRKPQPNKEWNPFMIYVFIFMLIGSNAINLIGLRNDLLNFSQKTDRQVALLAEVIRKVQNGEEVDVAAVLGKGNPEVEKDWEEALRELETMDTLYNKEKKKGETRARKASAKDSEAVPGMERTGAEKATAEESTRRRPGFY